MLFNTPNLLTYLRIALIPAFIVAYYLDRPWAHALATGLFILAALTDWLDGYLARRLEQTSPFGAFLDPVADKLMIAAALVLLVADPYVQAPSPCLGYAPVRRDGPGHSGPRNCRLGPA